MAELNDVEQPMQSEEKRPSLAHSHKSQTMLEFIETRKLDPETRELLLKYDEDMNGHFSKDEVVQIITDLKDQAKTAEMLDAARLLYKRLFIGASVLCMFLLAGMFGLSYAVAVLTANTQVKGDGTMTAAGNPNALIATDSSANVYHPTKHNGNYCIPQSESEVIIEQALSGRNVLVQLDEFVNSASAVNGDDGSHSIIEQLSSSGADINPETGEVCFKAPEYGPDQYFCIRPNDTACNEPDENGRMLQDYMGNGGSSTIIASPSMEGWP